MTSVEIWTKENCSYCTRAKQLLSQRSIPYTELKLNEDFTREILLERYPGAKTFPVIVVDGFYIGGYTQLEEMVNEPADNRKLLNEG
jgi:glutaredoxin